MTRRKDWADRATECCLVMSGDRKIYRGNAISVARYLRAAELKGFRRAVKLLLEVHETQEIISALADYMEEMK